MNGRRAWGAVAALLAGAAAAGLVGAVRAPAAARTATFSSAADVIHACVNTTNGLARIVARGGPCREAEMPVSWSVRGPQGEPGPKGDPGEGLGSVDDLAGIPCTTAAGAVGSVELATAADGVVTLRCSGAAGEEPAARLVINEIDYDQLGADAGGFVEVFNAGDAAATLDGVAIVLVNGGDSREYRRLALSGTLAPGGYVVWDVDAQNGSPDGVALLDTASGALLDALSYEGPISDALIGEVTFDLVEGTPLPVDVTDSNVIHGSLSRIPNGRDTDDAASDWAFTTTATRGVENVLTP